MTKNMSLIISIFCALNDVKEREFIGLEIRIKQSSFQRNIASRRKRIKANLKNGISLR